MGQAWEVVPLSKLRKPERVGMDTRYGHHECSLSHVPNGDDLDDGPLDGLLQDALGGARTATRQDVCGPRSADPRVRRAQAVGSR